MTVRFLLAFSLGVRILLGQVHLDAPSLQIELDPKIGYGIRTFRDASVGHDFISAENRLPLYRITLSRSDGSTTDITSAEAESVSQSRDGNQVTLVFEHPKYQLQVRCDARVELAPSRALWKIAIRNQGKFGLRSLFYPQWAAPLHLPNGSNRILYPFLDGQEFIEPEQHMKEGRTWRVQYPGQAALQLMAFHDASSGLLEMTRDGEGWVKHFRVSRMHGALDLSIEHNPNETPGTDISLPYETVMQTFGGDWHDAADIYRTWARQQKWAQRKVIERRPPAFLTSGLPIVTFEMRGDAHSAEWSMYFPPSNRLMNPEFHPAKVPDLMARYSGFFGSKVISNPFAWEHIAPWIAGDYFPPFVGEEVWRKMADSLHAARHPLFLLLSGARWGVTMDDVGYDVREKFLNETAPKAAAYDPLGKAVEEQPPWASSVVLCVGTNFAQKHIVDSFTGCVQRGASIVQYDQNHGGMASVCYNRQHGHSPGYGRWMVDETERIFQQIRTQGKRMNPDFAFTVEEPCEYFMPYWDMYMGRPYAFFGTGLDPTSFRSSVPLFIYVYHDYLLGYGGSNEMDIAHPYAEAIKIARKFTNGTLLEIDPGKPAFRLDTVPSPTEEMQLTRSCSLALRTYANHFLTQGRMLRDPQIVSSRFVPARMWRSALDTRRVQELPIAEIPVVLESTWESDEKIGYVFANWQTSAHQVAFIPQEYAVHGRNYRITAEGDGGKVVIQRDGPLPRKIQIEIPPLSAMLVKQERN